MANNLKMVDSMKEFIARETAAGRPIYPHSIELGRGNKEPDGTETRLVNPFSIRKVFMNPPGQAEGKSFAFVFVDPSADPFASGIDYEANEAMIWYGNGSQPGFYISNSTGVLITKVRNAGTSMAMAGSVDDVDLTNLTFQVNHTYTLEFNAYPIIHQPRDPTPQQIRDAEPNTIWYVYED